MGWEWALAAGATLLGITAFGMFVGAVRSAARERERRRNAESAVKRMEAARDVQGMDDVDPDRLGDFWDGMRDD